MKKEFISTFILIGVIFYFSKIVTDLKKSVERKEQSQLAKIQELDAGITFQTKRQRYILKVRDIILATTKRAQKPITVSVAYKIAESNLYYADKYGNDPNFLLAIQTRESLFDHNAVSSAGAIGLMQIWEPTGRVLCRMKGWEYHPKILRDIDQNNELASMYLQILKTSYNCKELILACYNGGPRNAHYYKVKNKKLAKETAEYVPAVMRFYKEYTKKLGMYLASNQDEFSS